MKKTFTWALATIAVLTVLTGCEKEDEDEISMDDVNKGVTTVPGNGGKEYGVVDLGLGVSVLWATCNIGATSPEQYGDYFAWGETQPKEDSKEYTWKDYIFCNNGDYSAINKYILDTDKSHNGQKDNKKILEAIDDAATQLMGSKWSIPSYDNYVELISRCNYKCCKLNGTWGYLFTSKDNGNSVFFPLSGMRDPKEIMYSGSRGYYWSKELIGDEENDIKTLNAYTLDLFEETNPVNSYQSREIGLPIRPVYTE